MPTLEELLLGKKPQPQPQEQPFRMQGVGPPDIQNILATAGLSPTPTGQAGGTGPSTSPVMGGLPARAIGPMTPGEPGSSAVGGAGIQQPQGTDAAAEAMKAYAAPPGYKDAQARADRLSAESGDMRKLWEDWDNEAIRRIDAAGSPEEKRQLIEKYKMAAGEGAMNGLVTGPPPAFRNANSEGVGEARAKFHAQKEAQFKLASDFLPGAPVYNAIRGGRRSREIPMNMRAAENSRRAVETMKYNSLYGGPEEANAKTGVLGNKLLQQMRRDTGEEDEQRKQAVGDQILGRLKTLQPGETTKGILDEYEAAMKFPASRFGYGKMYPGGQTNRGDDTKIGKIYADRPSVRTDVADNKATSDPNTHPDIVASIRAMKGITSGESAIKAFVGTDENSELTEEQLVESLLEPGAMSSIISRKGGGKALESWISNVMIHGNSKGGGTFSPDPFRKFAAGPGYKKEASTDIRGMIAGDYSYEETVKKIDRLKEMAFKKFTSEMNRLGP